MRFGLIILVLVVALGLLVLNHDKGEVFGLANDDFARLVVLGTIAAVIGAAVLRSYRGRLPDMLRGAVTWLALLVVLVGGYTYKAELERFGWRAVGALVPGVAVDEGPGSVLVAKSRDGHFRVRAAVNGQPVRLIVDTGASSVVLSDKDARTAGIDTATLDYGVRVSTANGATSAASVLLDTVEVGGIVERRVAALIARPGALETSLLGNSFLNRMASFTIEGDQLILRK